MTGEKRDPKILRNMLVPLWKASKALATEIILRPSDALMRVLEFAGFPVSRLDFNRDPRVRPGQVGISVLLNPKAVQAAPFDSLLFVHAAREFGPARLMQVLKAASRVLLDEGSVRAVVDIKFGANGIFRGSPAGTAWADGKEITRQVQPVSEAAVSATTSYCEYLFDRYGRFPVI